MFVGLFYWETRVLAETPNKKIDYLRTQYALVSRRQLR